jgi:hypothetical protein
MQSSKIRNSTVNKKTFRKLLKEIRKQASSMGMAFTLYKRKPYYSVDRGPMYGVRGYFENLKNKIVVTSLGKNGRADILHTAFHELRHAQHKCKGLYKSYYDPKIYQYRDYVRGLTRKPRGYKLNLDEAHKAEVDCDRYASEMLKKLNITHSLKREYRYEDTMAYQIYLSERNK